jgi:hypothetical protein
MFFARWLADWGRWRGQRARRAPAWLERLEDRTVPSVGLLPPLLPPRPPTAVTQRLTAALSASAAANLAVLGGALQDAAQAPGTSAASSLAAGDGSAPATNTTSATASTTAGQSGDVEISGKGPVVRTLNQLADAFGDATGFDVRPMLVRALAGVPGGLAPILSLIRAELAREGGGLALQATLTPVSSLLASRQVGGDGSGAAAGVSGRRGGVPLLAVGEGGPFAGVPRSQPGFDVRSLNGGGADVVPVPTRGAAGAPTSLLTLDPAAPVDDTSAPPAAAATAPDIALKQFLLGLDLPAAKPEATAGGDPSDAGDDTDVLDALLSLLADDGAADDAG